jgi:hypothetical protein
MKKIIIAFEGTHFSEGAFEFARRLNELQPVLLTGVFLPQTELANVWSYGDALGAPFTPVMETEEAEVVKQNIAHFEKRCIGNGIDFRVHKDFYDLVILGSEIFYQDTGLQFSRHYLKEALQHMECPVLLVPEQFEFPESNVLAYDGSEEALFAIKQFAYIFPELTDRETLLVYASPDSDDDFPDIIKIEELAARHFSDLTLYKLNVDPKKHFSFWMAERKSSILVSGSYGGTEFLQLFKKSFVQDIIATHKVPVFIAHK